MAHAVTVDISVVPDDGVILEHQSGGGTFTYNKTTWDGSKLDVVTIHPNFRVEPRFNETMDEFRTLGEVYLNGSLVYATNDTTQNRSMDILSLWAPSFNYTCDEKFRTQTYVIHGRVDYADDNESHMEEIWRNVTFFRTFSVLRVEHPRIMTRDHAYVTLYMYVFRNLTNVDFNARGSGWADREQHYERLEPGPHNFTFHVELPADPEEPPDYFSTLINAIDEETNKLLWFDPGNLRVRYNISADLFTTAGSSSGKWNDESRVEPGRVTHEVDHGNIAFSASILLSSVVLAVIIVFSGPSANGNRKGRR